MLKKEKKIEAFDKIMLGQYRFLKISKAILYNFGSNKKFSLKEIKLC